MQYTESEDNMFDWLAELVEGIVNFFQIVWSFINHLFQEIVYIITLLYTVVLNFPSYLVWLPSAVTAIIITGLGVCIVYKIAGRD